MFNMFWYGSVDNGFHRVNHAAVAVNKKIYSFGGFTDCHPVSNNIDIWVFNTESFCWSSLLYSAKTNDAKPPQLFGHSVVKYKDKIYLWGGLKNNETSNNNLYCFDPETDEWSLPEVKGSIPNGTDGHTASIVNDFMYLIGGYGNGSLIPLDNIYRLDLRTYKWQCISVRGWVPDPLDFHTASVIESRIYMYGGRGMRRHLSEYYNNQIVYFDTETETWHNTHSCGFHRDGRRSHSAVVYRNEIYIFFGFNSVRNEFYDDILKYSPISNEWKCLYLERSNALQSKPCKRRRQCCVLIGDRMYAFGGISQRCNGENCEHYPPHNSSNPWLVPHSDLWILDFFPTLRNRCMFEISQNRNLYVLVASALPSNLREEILQVVIGTLPTRKVCPCSRSNP